MSIEEIFKALRRTNNSILKEFIEDMEELKKSINTLENNTFLSFNEGPVIIDHFKKAFTDEHIEKEKQRLKDELSITEIAYDIFLQIKNCLGKNRIMGKVFDFGKFYIGLCHINKESTNNFDINVIAKIIGMAIYNNNALYETNPKSLDKDLLNEGSETKAVLELKPYFNKEGDVVSYGTPKHFIDNLFILFEDSIITNDENMFKQEYGTNFEALIRFLSYKLIDAKPIKEETTIIETTIKKDIPKLNKEERRRKRAKQRQNEQELATYFDGEQILRSCESIEVFEKLVLSCYLNEEQSIRIITKMKTFMSKEENKIPFLTLEEQEIYKLAIEKQLGNIRIKNIIEEINMLLEMYPSSSSEDKEYIQEEVKSLISNLRYILKVNSAELKLSY